MKRDGDYIPHVDSGTYPLRAGNAVVPLVDGEPAFRRICEAVEAARRSVWVTIAFLHTDFRMPDGRGDLFDVLDRARARGLDVRVIFWRHLQLEEISPGVHFVGSPAQHRQLADRGSRFLARWDQAHRFYCQHQKSWLIDAGRADEVAFVGGINLDSDSMVPVGHPPNDGGSTHDVYVEVRGPAASDVHHNFVQRWNEASDRAEPDGCWPDARSQNDLEFPVEATAPIGDVPVQIQRTVRRERYTDTTAAPGAGPFEIAAGEFSVVDQYRRALDAARRTIYIEDQAIGAPEVIDRLAAALERGVEVVFLVPVDPNREMVAARGKPKYQAFWDSLAALGESPRFTLAAIASNRPEGGYQNIYIHAKIALVDDLWCTIGSANVGNRSFYGDTELNASFWHRDTVLRLRAELLREHLGVDTTELDDVAAMQLYARIARQNTQRHRRGDKLEGLAFALDPATYAL
jgi:cardiolipin synthase